MGGDRAGNDVGEARRILSSFLLFLENAESESIVVAATNHRAILDRALFRRFDLVLSYALPTPEEAEAVLRARLRSLACDNGWDRIREMADGKSQAELVKAAEIAAKRALLSGQKCVDTAKLIDVLGEKGGSTGG